MFKNELNNFSRVNRTASQTTKRTLLYPYFCTDNFRDYH